MGKHLSLPATYQKLFWKHLGLALVLSYGAGKAYQLWAAPNHVIRDDYYNQMKAIHVKEKLERIYGWSGPGE